MGAEAPNAAADAAQLVAENRRRLTERVLRSLDTAVEKLVRQKAEFHGNQRRRLPAHSANLLRAVFRRVALSYFRPGGPARAATGPKGRQELAAFAKNFGIKMPTVSRDDILDWRRVCAEPVSVGGVEYLFEILGKGEFTFSITAFVAGVAVLTTETTKPLEWFRDLRPITGPLEVLRVLFGSLGRTEQQVALNQLASQLKAFFWFPLRSWKLLLPTFSAATAAIILITLRAPHDHGADRVAWLLTVKDGVFETTTQRSTRVQITTEYEHGGRSVESFRLADGHLYERVSFPDGSQDTYDQRGFWAAPDGRCFKLDIGRSRKWMRPGVFVPAAAKDGQFAAVICGRRFPLTGWTSGSGTFPYLFRYAEIPTTVDCVAGGKRTCSFVEEGGGEVFEVNLPD